MELNDSNFLLEVWETNDCSDLKGVAILDISQLKCCPCLFLTDLCPNQGQSKSLFELMVVYKCTCTLKKKSL